MQKQSNNNLQKRKNKIPLQGETITKKQKQQNKKQLKKQQWEQKKKNLIQKSKQQKLEQKISKDDEELSEAQENQEIDKETQELTEEEDDEQAQQETQQQQQTQSDDENSNDVNDDIEEEQKLNSQQSKKVSHQQKQNEDENEGSQAEITLGEDIDDKRKVIFILEKAPLEIAKINKNIELLNCDDHRNFITRRLKQDFAKYRPDIVHQCLLTILDSPLNKAGFVKVYVHTEKNQLIEINPSTKIPRTFKRFSALFCQLLQKLRIRAQQSSETLLKIIKNPITRHIPFDCQKIGTSTQARLVKLSEFLPSLPQNEPVVFVVGAVATGNPAIEIDYINESVCISKYSLSGAYCLAKIINAYEDMWKIH